MKPLIHQNNIVKMGVSSPVGDLITCSLRQNALTGADSISVSNSRLGPHRYPFWRLEYTLIRLFEVSVSQSPLILQEYRLFQGIGCQVFLYERQLAHFRIPRNSRLISVLYIKCCGPMEKAIHQAWHGPCRFEGRTMKCICIAA